MVLVRGFYGIRYDCEKVGGLDKVVALPYDVINEEQRENLLKNSPYNVVHLDLPKAKPNDKEDPYSKASRLFKEWRRDGILKQDKERMIYYCEHDFSFYMAGIKRKRTRYGFIALLGIEPYENRNILPHERTLKEPKEDRYKLLKKVKANLSPIFCLFKDSNKSLINYIKGSARSKDPDLEVKDNQGGQLRLWALPSKEVGREVDDFFGLQKLIIADGHHRYESALRYHNELVKKNSKDVKGSRYIMSYFSPIDDPGLVVFPYHRLVRGLKEEKLTRLEEDLKRHFNLKKIRGSEPRKIFSALKRSGAKSPSFFMMDQKKRNYLISLDLEKAPADISKELDVVVLEELILKKLLGISSSDLFNQSYVFYESEEKKVFEEMKKGKFQLAFLLNPVSLSALSSWVQKGKLMPEKSTYFYPKILTGLVFRVL